MPHRFIGRVGGIFQHAAFVAQVPDIAVAAVNVFGGLLDRDIVCARVVNGFFARDDAPFAPRSDDLQFRSKRLGRQLEAYLIVALARTAVCEGIRAKFLGELHLALREKRPRKGSAQQILMFVNGTRAQRGPDVTRDEFLAKILDVCGTRAGGERLLARRFQILLLTEIADHGDHLAAAVIFLEPRNDDGGIQTSGICKHNFLRQFVLLDLRQN